MDKINDYEILEKVTETRSSVIYRARKDGHHNTNIIKLLKSKKPSLSEVARFKQEYEIIKNVNIDGLVKR